jgi:PAS domain S-box-containing protein
LGAEFPEAVLSVTTRIISRVFDVPIAAMGIVAERRICYRCVMGQGLIENARENSFCAHAILGTAVFVVEDALKDLRFEGHPLVTGGPQIRFYAGVPIRSETGLPIATVFVMDRKPRAFSEKDRLLLRDFGALIEKSLVPRETFAATRRGRVDVDAKLTSVLGGMAEAVIFFNARGQIVSTNPVADELPDFVLELLSGEEEEGNESTVFDEMGNKLLRDLLPHQLALRTGRSQERCILGVRAQKAQETRWFEINCEAITADRKLAGIACSLHDITQHQQLVIAVQSSERRLQAMAANVPGVIYQFRTYPDGRVEFPYISPGIERVYGVTQKEWRENPDWAIEAIIDEDKESYATAFIAAQATLSRFDWEGRTSTARPGEVIWIHCQSLPSVEVEGSVLWNGVVSDITSSKRQAEALRVSEERFRIVVEQTHQMIYDIDVLNGATVWEGATGPLLGRTPAEMQALSLSGWMELIHPDDRAFAASEVERSVALDEPFSVRYRFLRSDGSYIWAHDRGTYVRGIRGQPVRMLGAISDVTAEVNALRQSEESHRRAEALIAAIPDTVIRVTTMGDVVDVRHLNEWGYGAELQEPSVTKLGELMSSHLVSVCLDHVRKVVEHWEPERFELIVERDCVKRDFEVRVSPSGANEAVMVLRDVSEQRAVDRLKNQFVSTVSHELRTPLASIRGALGLMAAGIAGELSPMTKELSDLALDNTKRLERLINDLLDLESSDSGQLRLTVEVCDLGHLLEKTIRQVTPFAASLGIGLSFESQVAKAECRVDADRFVQVISNLLSNAIKHSRTGSEVVVRLAELAESWYIEVQNTGNPIPESFRARIFQRFAMADASDSRTLGGTGLGLAIAKALVERMGGKIDYESVDDVTKFFIELPRKHSTSIRAVS